MVDEGPGVGGAKTQTRLLPRLRPGRKGATARAHGRVKIHVMRLGVGFGVAEREVDDVALAYADERTGHLAIIGHEPKQDPGLDLGYDLARLQHYRYDLGPSARYRWRDMSRIRGHSLQNP